jgi:hypothetical protein
MTRRILAVSLAVVLAACGSSDSGKKDAAGNTTDTAAAPGADTAVAPDVARADAGLDGPADTLAITDAPATDASQPDAAADAAATPDAAADVAADVGPDSSPDVAPDAVAMCGHIKCDCTFFKNGKTFKLSGKYRIDNIFPDFKVREVTFAEDLRVQKVTFLPDSCGKWQQDDIFPDFKIQIVTFGEDFSIRYVDFSPGLPP